MKSRMTYALTAAAAITVGCAEIETDNPVVGQLASDRIEITAEFPEPITELPVAEGTRIAAGDIVFRQDTRRAEARLAEATAALAEARARLDEAVRGPRAEQVAAARASLEGAEKAFAFREAEFRRIRDIHARGLASQDALDSAAAALDSAAANLEVRRAELDEALTGTTVEELAQIEAAVASSEARRTLASIDLDRHTPTAPVAAFADTRLFEIGERPQPGQPVYILLAGEQPHARVYVPAPLRARVQPGTAARVYIDGIAEPVPGRVRWVASEAAFTPYFALTEHDRGRLSYEAKVDLEVDAGRSRLPDGAPVEVRFGISE